MSSKVVRKAKRILEKGEIYEDGGLPGLSALLDEINNVSDLMGVVELLFGPVNETEGLAYLKCVRRIQKSGKRFSKEQKIILKNNGIFTEENDMLEMAKFLGVKLD